MDKEHYTSKIISGSDNEPDLQVFQGGNSPPPSEKVENESDYHTSVMSWLTFLKRCWQFSAQSLERIHAENDDERRSLSP